METTAKKKWTRETGEKSPVDLAFQGIEVNPTEHRNYHPQEARDHIYAYKERGQNYSWRKSKPVTKSYAQLWIKKARQIVALNQGKGDLDRWGGIQIEMQQIPECNVCGSRENVSRQDNLCNHCRKSSN